MKSTSSTNTKKQRVVKKIFGIAIAASFLVVPLAIFLFGDGNLEAKQSYCPFKMLTGFPCPGCGITKSMVAVYSGNLLASFSYHIFGLFTMCFSAFLICLLTWELFSGKDYFNGFLYSTKLAAVLAIVLIVYHIVRLIVFISSHSWQEIMTESIWR